MKTAILGLIVSLTFVSASSGPQPSASPRPNSALEASIATFDVDDAILRDGISELSLKNVEGLHLGFEEVIRDNIQDDPRALSSHFSLHLRGKTVRQVLDALCNVDARYTWSEDKTTINVFPRLTADDPSYLLNLTIERMPLVGIPSPVQALTPLSKLFPNQQVGYFGSDSDYSHPWDVTLEHLTVRQFANRISEHMGPMTTWVWQGGKQERMFTFFKGGFHPFRPNP